jgi:hypothetical protein
MLVVFSTCIYLSVFWHKNSKNCWLWFWLFSALLFNPFIKVVFEQEFWQFVGVVYFVVFLLFLYLYSLSDNFRSGIWAFFRGFLKVILLFVAFYIAYKFSNQ